MIQFLLIHLNQKSISKWMLIGTLLFLCNFSFSQISSVNQHKKSLISRQDFIPVSLFTSGSRSSNTIPIDFVKNSAVLSLDKQAVSELKSARYAALEMSLPAIGSEKEMVLLLKKTNLFDYNFNVYTSSNRAKPYQYEKGMFFDGIVEGYPDSRVAISIFEDEIMGLILLNDENLVIGKIKGSAYDHILYKESDLIAPSLMECHTPDKMTEAVPFGQERLSGRANGNCLRIYVEIGYSTNLDKGGVNPAINFATGLFHQNKIIYDAEQIDMIISEIFVWDETDPYDMLEDTITPPNTSVSTTHIRNRFQEINMVMNGDLGQLLVSGGSSTGGIAADVVNSLLNPSVSARLCITRMALGTEFEEYPVYSRIAKVFSHELGHLLGSRHTHACSWNGDNTQIDDYGNCNSDGTPIVDENDNLDGEGAACMDLDNLLLSVTPTIMSYFDSRNFGPFPLNNGFGTQPGNRVRQSVQDALDMDIISANCLPPYNDLCIDAEVLICGSTSYGNTEKATATGNVLGICGEGGNAGNGLWYKVTGNGQIYTLSTENSDFDTQINVYTGECGSLVCLTGDDNSGPGNSALLSFCTTIGTSYYVFIDGSNGAFGDFSLTLTCATDNTGPQIICPMGITQTNDAGECGAIITYPDASATDICDVAGINYSQNSNTFFDVGINVVTVTATDGKGNTSTCSFNVEVTDDEVPVIMCMDSSIIFNGEEEIVLDIAGMAEAMDNCPGVIITLDKPVITCEDLGNIIPITVTATDESNNQATCISMVTIEGLPCGWSQDPDGINCPDGNLVTYDVPSEEFTLESTNCYFTSPFNADSYSYAKHDLCGTGSITAQVTSIDANNLGWAGVSIRENSNAGSKKVQLMTNLSQFHRREIRNVTNGNSFPQQSSAFGRYWLRIVRNGNSLIGYASTNGNNWVQTMAANITMPECIEVGLVLTNYSNGIVTATLKNVEVTEGVLPLQMQAGDLVIPHENDKQSWTVYPNPTNGLINILRANQSESPSEIQIMDALGRNVDLIRLEANLSGILTVDIQHLPGGIYYLKSVDSANNVEVQKIILQH